MNKPQAPIRVLGLDLDGTVFDDKKNISPRNRQAIQAAIAKGVVVLPATGRPLTGVPREFLELPGVEYALTSNGAAVICLRDNSYFYKHCIPPQDALRAFALLGRFDCMCDVYVEGRPYTTRTSYDAIEHFADPSLWEYMRKTRIVVDDLDAFVEQNADCIEKFSVSFSDPALRLEAWRLLDEDGAFNVVSSVPHNIELNTVGVDKGTGLLALAQKLGIPPEAVMACGDSGNDVDMLKKVGFGVAMANADPEVKAVADAFTATNNEDGVALAIEQYVL